MLRLASLLLFILCSSTALWSSDINLSSEGDSISLFDYFYQQEGTPVIKINTDIGKLMRRRLKEEDFDGQFTFTDPTGTEKVLDVTVRTRGNMRKQVCNNPPLKINMKKGDVADMGFLRKIDDLKLALQCSNTGYAASQLGREHMIYELYALIDKFHILTKQVKVELWTGDDLKEELDALLVEDENQIAHRLDARILEKVSIRTGSLDRDHYLKMSFFQAMILNTDWTIPNKHNVEIMKVPELQRVIAVPYDFDYAGIVGTSYAVPHESLPIENVQQRYFMGFQVTEEEAMNTAEYFRTMRSAFEECVNTRSYLDDSDKREVLAIIDDFYDMIESEKDLKRHFVSVE